MLDTRHFDRDFTDRLLTALSDAGPLDEQTDGLLVHGENFQALNLLQKRYRGAVRCAYIDPPYNTDASAILYKNGYKDSSWTTLMENRIVQSVPTLMNESVFIAAIDDTEMTFLSHILEICFPKWERNVVVVNHHPAGAGLEGTNISCTHEYAIFMTPPNIKILRGEKKGIEQTERGFVRTGTAESNLRIGRPNSFYAILVEPETSKVVGAEEPPQGADYPKGNTSEGWVRIYPIGADGTERVWRRSYESFLNECEKGNIICKNGKSIYQIIEETNRRRPVFSNWTDKKYNAGVYGSNLLTDIIGKPGAFSYPKSIHNVEDCIKYCAYEDGGAVLDYFAGSGTTGHAVINLNREDGGKRKYILVEMGDYFHTVLAPRLKKIIYSPDWKEGKPVSRKGGTQLFKYLRLESYEDALDSLRRTPPPDDLLQENAELAEDYQLRYALGVETSGSACLLGQNFADPFAYTLSVVRDGVRREIPVDLPETFNYLIGLHIASRCRIDDLLAITGADAEGRQCLILWRDLDKVDHGALDAWFARNRDRFDSPSLDLIYANGDHTLNAIKQPTETWIAETIEPIFRELMFEEKALAS